MFISAVWTGLLARCDFFDCTFQNSCYSHANKADTDRLSSVGNTTSGRACVGAIGLRCDLKTKVEAKDFLETAKGAQPKTKVLAGANFGTLPDLNCCLYARR
jgi:hypothetical protein